MERQVVWRSEFSWEVVGAQNAVTGFLRRQSLQVSKMLSFAVFIRERDLG